MAIFTISTGICAVFLFILGLCMRRGKGLMLLAGYNTLSKEERDKVDQKKLSTIAGNLLLRLALWLALSGAAMYFRLTWVWIVLFIALAIDSCIAIAKLSRVVPDSASNSPAAVKRGGIIAGVSGAITLLVLLAVGGMFYYGEREPVVSVTGEKIVISAMYGLEISLSDVADVALVEKSMREIGVGHRANGYGGGKSLKGHFGSDVLGKHMLFVRPESSPTIWVDLHEGEDVYISYYDAEKTRGIYAELRKGFSAR